MTGDQMRAIREALGISIRGAARYHGQAEASFRQMEAGMRAIPALIAAWFDDLGKWIENHPPVKKTR
jgi:hypothetical protein